MASTEFQCVLRKRGVVCRVFFRFLKCSLDGEVSSYGIPLRLVGISVRQAMFSIVRNILLWGGEGEIIDERLLLLIFGLVAGGKYLQLLVLGEWKILSFLTIFAHIIIIVV